MILIYLLTALGMGICGLLFWILWTAEDGPSLDPRDAPGIRSLRTDSGGGI